MSHNSFSFLFSLVLLFIFSLQSIGQIQQTNRLEIPLSKTEPLYEIAPANEDGLFLYRQVSLNNTRLLELIKLDTIFQEEWKGYITVEPKFELVGKRTGNKKLFCLMRHVDFQQKNLMLYIVRQNDGHYEKHLIKNVIPFIPTEFQVTEHGAIVGGYFSNVPVVVFYSFHTHTSRIVPGLLNEAGELTQIKTSDDGNFTVLISSMTFTGDRTIWIKQYDREGSLLYHMPVKTEYNKHLLFGRSVETGDETQLIAGTYGNRKSEYSKGIFLARIDAAGNQQVKYYNYGDLSNFFKYLKVKREKRIRDRIERRKIKGKKIKFNYRFIVHEVVPYKNQFVMLGEAFYPKYVNTDSRFSSGFFYTGPTGLMPGMRIFDGFRYTHAVVIGFDSNGRVLWDNSFEINDVKTYSLEQFVKLEMQPDKIALLYLFENQIRSKIIEGEEVLEGKTFEPIRTFSENAITRRERNEGVRNRMDYWYRDYFYASGVQLVGGGGDEERRVFYVNKVSYSNQPEDN